MSFESRWNPTILATSLSMKQKCSLSFNRLKMPVPIGVCNLMINVCSVQSENEKRDTEE